MVIQLNSNANLAITYDDIISRFNFQAKVVLPDNSELMQVTNDLKKKSIKFMMDECLKGYLEEKEVGWDSIGRGLQMNLCLYTMIHSL